MVMMIVMMMMIVVMMMMVMVVMLMVMMMLINGFISESLPEGVRRHEVQLRRDGRRLRSCTNQAAWLCL